MRDFYIKQGDELPVVEHTAKDAVTDRIVDLTDATAAVFVWRLENDDVANSVSGVATMPTPTRGELQYAWVAGDTDVVGSYYGEFRVTFPTGERTFPTRGYIRFDVVKDLDS